MGQHFIIIVYTYVCFSLYYIHRVLFFFKWTVREINLVVWEANIWIGGLGSNNYFPGRFFRVDQLWAKPVVVSTRNVPTRKRVIPIEGDGRTYFCFGSPARQRKRCLCSFSRKRRLFYCVNISTATTRRRMSPGRVSWVETTTERRLSNAQQRTRSIRHLASSLVVFGPLTRKYLVQQLLYSFS